MDWLKRLGYCKCNIANIEFWTCILLLVRALLVTAMSICLGCSSIWGDVARRLSKKMHSHLAVLVKQLVKFQLSKKASLKGEDLDVWHIKQTDVRNSSHPSLNWLTICFLVSCCFWHSGRIASGWARISTVRVYLFCGVWLTVVILRLEICLKAINCWDVDPQEIGDQNDHGAPWTNPTIVWTCIRLH